MNISTTEKLNKIKSRLYYNNSQHLHATAYGGNMDKHYLANMIFNLEERKNLKKVEFTKDAVREVLEYLKILQSNSQQLIELKAENERQNNVIEKGNQKLLDYYNKKINELDKEYNDDLDERLNKIEKLQQQLKEKDEEIAELNRSVYKINIDYNHKTLILEKALELACEEVPCKCPQPQERYNLQNEYGSDEPYYIEEGGCEFDNPSSCLQCTINHFKQKATKFMEA